MTPSSLTGLLIFCVTYALISARRLSWLPLDRPTAALLGAVACVGLGVLSPREALAAIDGSTLLLLFGMMGMGAVLAADGFFAQLEARLAALAKTPARLLGLLVWSCGLLSALLTNDAVCVLGAPVVVGLVQRQRLPPLPFLLALATAANTGSVATLVGNPQNMLCGMLGGLSYREHLLLMGPVAILGLAINHGLLWWVFREQLQVASLTLPTERARMPMAAWVSLAVIGITAILYTLGVDLAWTAAGGFALLILLRGHAPGALWPRIDWTILLFFGGLFVVVEGLVRSGLPAQVLTLFPLASDNTVGSAWSGLRLASVFLVGSNVVSNVPFILVIREHVTALPNPTVGWELLAMASTFAGNLTLLGSVANIIVAEAGRDIGGLPFRDHLKVGLPLALITTLMGALWIGWIRG